MKVHLRFKLKTWPLAPLGVILGSTALASPYVACPECGAKRVKKLHKRDWIDRVSTMPWSKLQRWLGGALYDCPLCRLQFYDCRAQLLEAKAPVAASPLQTIVPD
jgi:DNA-directed RNA polymerase subunit RPC12/RpoP